MLDIELVIITRIIVAAILGSLIGIEREISHKPAGLRTHILVAMGSCLITGISIFYFSLDYARVVANIIVGIGFIGAGAIIGSQGHVQGITTAASIWIAASMGIACGVGYFYVAVVVTLISLCVLRFLKIAEKKIIKKKKR